MEVSAATDALLRKLRIEQRKLQQNIHFPDGVDAEHHQRGRQNDHQQQQDEEERQRRNQQQQQNLENERERKYRSDNEAHLLLEIESLHDRIRNLESSLQYERERHQQTRELLRVALKPPADDQEKAHKTYHDHHSGAFMADGPNVRGDDMASILVGAASPGSRIGDVSVHERESVQPFRAYQNYRPLRHQKDGIRLASSPFPAEGSVLGAHTPDQLPPHYDRYEIYSSPSSTTPGRQSSASKAAKMIYQKAHQLEHSPRESRAVLSDYQQYQQQQQQQNYRGDVNSEGEQFFYDHQQHQNNNFHDDDVDRRTTASGTGRSRHMTPTPSRASSTPGGGRGGVGNRRAGSATPSSTRLRPFGTAEKRFAPISVFGEQALHRSMYEEGTPRSQVRPTQSSDHKFMRHGGMTTSLNTSGRKRAGTPTMTTLRSPAMMR